MDICIQFDKPDERMSAMRIATKLCEHGDFRLHDEATAGAVMLSEKYGGFISLTDSPQPPKPATPPESSEDDVVF